MPATLFCWTNVPKMKLIDGPVMSGSDWLSVIATISYPTVRVLIATVITPDVDGPLRL